MEVEVKAVALIKMEVKVDNNYGNGTSGGDNNSDISVGGDDSCSGNDDGNDNGNNDGRGKYCQLMEIVNSDNNYYNL